MFIDHLSYVLFLSGRLPAGALYTAGRAVGRMAFVIYAFLLVNGFDRTHDRKRYFSRLAAFAALSQLPFTLAFTSGNYRSYSYSQLSFDLPHFLPLLFVLAVCYFTVCKKRIDSLLCSLAAAFTLGALRLRLGGIMLLGEELNVFYTLGAAMAAMLCLRYARSEERSVPRLLLMLAALGVELFFVQMRADYGLFGLALIVLLYLFREEKTLQLAAAALWCFSVYGNYWPDLAGALFALVPLALYNGRLGKKMRTAFYVFYPAHLALLGAVFVLLAKM